MSRLLGYEPKDFSLDEKVSFLYGGSRLTGIVVRVYNTRTLYHVEHDGRRYEVDPVADDMQEVWG